MAKKSKGPLSDKEITSLATRASRETGLPISLIRAVIKQESGGNPRAGSSAGAQGLMQLMPGTARGLGVTDVWDPWQNVLGGSKYLKQQLDTFDGDVQLALSAYNSGPAGAEHQGRIEAYPETQNYVKRVMEYEQQFKGAEAAGTPAQGMSPVSGAVAQPSFDQRALQAAAGGPGFGSLAIRYEKPQEVSFGGPISSRVAGMQQSAEAPKPGVVPLSPEAALQQGGGQAPQAIAPPVQASAPASTDTAGSTVPSGEAPPASGLNAEFQKRFAALQKAVRATGGDLTIYSGARDAEHQAKLYADAVRKYGSESEARKWVAPPGKSNHDPTSGSKYGFGSGAVASDLRGDLAVAHKLAGQYGLMFPLANEAWHIELAGIRNK